MIWIHGDGLIRIEWGMNATIIYFKGKEIWNIAQRFDLEQSLKLLFSNKLLQSRDCNKGSLKCYSILSKFGKAGCLPQNSMVPIIFLHGLKFHLFHSKSCGWTNRVEILGHGWPHSSCSRPRWSPRGVVSIAHREHSTTWTTENEERVLFKDLKLGSRSIRVLTTGFQMFEQIREECGICSK